MLATNKTDRFLDRLIEDTGAGRITWQREQPPEVPRPETEEYTGAVYLTTIKGQRFRLSPLRYRYYTGADRFVWTETVALEVIDERDTIVWRFPQSPKIPQLLETVQYAASGIERIIDDVLAEG